MKKITLCIVMLLMGIVGWSQQENFDDASVVVPTTPGPWVLPSGTWQIFDNGVGAQTLANNWTLNPQATYPAYSGTQSAYISRFNIGAGNTSEDYLATPLYTVPANPQFRFYTRTTLAGDQGTVYQIKAAPVGSDPTLPASYTLTLAEWTENDLTDNYDVWEEKVLDLTLAQGGQYYFAFVRKFTQNSGAISGDRWLVDDFKFVSKCLDVTDIVPACLSTSASLSWTSSAAAGQWAIHVVPAGQPFDPAVGTPIIATTNSGFIVDHVTQPADAPMTTLTEYDFYIQSVCDLTSSEWVMATCTTQAAPPECGGNYVDPGGADGNYGNNENVTTTICPETVGDIVTVTFTSFNTEATWDGIYVYDGPSTASPMIASDLGSGNGPMDPVGGYWGNTIPGPFTSSSPDGCLTFVFVSDSSGTFAGFSADVACGPPPACPKPGLLTAADVNAVDAVITWATISPATSWEVLVLPDGSPAPTDASVGVPGVSPFTADGLTPSACYDVYVRANCEESGNGLSTWAGPLSFCTTTLPPVCGGNYADIGGTTATYNPGMNEIVTICAENDTDVVTVHFTQFATEPSFDGIYVYNGDSTSAPLIPSANGTGFGNLTVAGAYWGTTAPEDFVSSPGGCLTFQFISDGSVQYDGWLATVTCAPPPPCPKPTVVSVLSTTDTTATITFTNNGPGDVWEVVAVPCGSAAPDGTTAPMASGTEIPVTITGLTPDTCYDFYVRANCESSANGFSDWSGPKSDNTQVAPPVCGGTFTDAGGANGTYPGGSNSIVTICPETAGDVVTVHFTMMQIEANWDGFYVYNGATTASPLIPSTNGAGFNANLATPGAYWGTALPDDFISSSPDGCLTFQFFSDNFGQQDGWEANVYCAPPPACPQPTGLVVNNMTSYTATVTWASSGPGDIWDVYAVPCGSPAPDETTVPNYPGVTSSALIENLDPDTCYDFYVRANCNSSDNGYSLWSGPRTNTTQVAPPECGGQYVDLGGSTGPYPGGANSVVTVCAENPGEIVTVIFESFNTENNFDGIYVFDGNSTASPQIASTNGTGFGNLTLPGAFWGSALPGPFQSSNPEGCLTFQFISDGSVNLDGFVANVICSPCPIPMNITAEPNTFHVTLNWNFAEGSTYNVYIVPTGSPAPDENTVPTYTGITSVPWTSPDDLSQLTTYDVYVQAVCPNGTDTSAWSLPATFTTLPTCPQPINVSSSTTAQGATITWTEVGPATQWEVWVVPSGSPVPVPGTGIIVTMDPAVNPISYDTLNGPGGSPLIPGLYDFYVHSICSPTDSSVMVGPHEFYVLSADPICADVVPENPDINSEGIINLCPGESCVDLTATYVDNRATTSYQVESIPFAPPFPFDGGIELDISTDDIWGPVFNLPFNFCFYGTNYTQVKVGSNGVITFNNDTDTYCPWNTDVNVTVPNPAFPILNAIYGVYQDINPAVDTPVLHTINYQVLGTAPCRVFVINFVNIAQFSCNLNAPLQTSQIVLYETSNNVEVYVKDRVPCMSWNEGSGVIGIQNVDGSDGLTPPDRNLGPWEAHDEAWRFKPDGESLVTFSWLMDGEFYSSEPTIEVCVNELTTMTAQAVYNGCGGVITTKTSDVILSPTQIDVLPIADVTSCTEYVLPDLALGNYFTEPGGLGTQYNGGDSITSSMTLWVYASVTANGETCFDEESFDITIGTQATPGDVVICGSYILPELEAGNYYTGDNGTGDILIAGTEITTDMTLWVYDPNSSCLPASFTIDIIEQPVLDPIADVNQCASYTVPTPAIGHFYSESGGLGTLLDGTVISSGTTTVYQYVAVEGCTPVEISFVVNIGTLTVTTPGDQEVCDLYVLPELTTGGYFTAAGGTGDALAAGAEITETITLWVYATDGDCTAEDFFTVTVNHTPVLVDPFADVTQCAPYTLPTPTVGHYYDQPGGTGNLMDGVTINAVVPPAPVTIYLYAENTGCPAVEEIFEVFINTGITADDLADVQANCFYVLPTLSAGNAFWTLSGGPAGGGTQLQPGDVITMDQDIWVYATSVGCEPSETSFTVDITSPPAIDLPDELSSCTSIELPTLPAGAFYYSDAEHTMPLISTTITSTTIVYAYAELIAPDGTACGTSDQIQVNIGVAPVLVAPSDVVACGSYTLPALETGAYYHDQNGVNPVEGPITQSQTVWIYAADATNPACYSEVSFTVTITPAPQVYINGQCVGAAFTLSAVDTEGNAFPSGSTYSWSGPDGITGTDATLIATATGTYTVTVNVANCTGEGLGYEVTSIACTIQKGISANNDGMNDNFDLVGQNVGRLEIFNRYGLKVYSMNDYTNQWYGQSDKGEELPDGTYYYMIQYKDGKASQTGWIYINRKQ